MNSTADTDTYLTHSKISRQSNALDCSHVRLEEAISLVGRRHIMPLLRAPLEHMDNVVIVLHRNVFALPTPVREIGSQEPRPASDARSKWWSVSWSNAKAIRRSINIRHSPDGGSQSKASVLPALLL